MRSIPVYVVTNPNGKTQVRSTPLNAKWLASPEAQGFVQTVGSMNWKAARRISRLYRAAKARVVS